MSQSKLKDLNDYAGDFSSALYGLTDNFSQSARRIGKSESYLYKCAEPESETELKAYELPYHEKFPALVQFLFDKYRKINSKFFALNGRQDDELAEIIRLLGEAINLAKDGDKQKIDELEAETLNYVKRFFAEWREMWAYYYRKPNYASG